jgi:hypothetical protein
MKEQANYSLCSFKAPRRKEEAGSESADVHIQDGRGWLASRSGRLTSKDKAHGSHRMWPDGLK